MLSCPHQSSIPSEPDGRSWGTFYCEPQRSSSGDRWMLDCMESMAWHMLAAIRYGRPPLLTLAFAPTLASQLATIGWCAPSVAPTLNGSIIRLANDPCFLKGQKSRRAINLATNRTVRDVNGDAPLIPASMTGLVMSATALPAWSERKVGRCSPSVG